MWPEPFSPSGSRVAITMPFRPSLHCTGIEMVKDVSHALYDPAHVSLPSVTEKLPPVRDAVAVPRNTWPLEEITATGRVTEQLLSRIAAHEVSAIFHKGHLLVIPPGAILTTLRQFSEPPR